jgi:ABC-type Mn2+/Zn2+ transport system ATPase subunit
MGRRLALARCLALDAKLRLLDEPFAGVDLSRALRILERMRSLPAPVLLVSHEPAVLAAAGAVVELDGPPLRVRPR